MNKQQVFVTINQSIEEVLTRQTEKWQHQAQGVLYELTSYNKLIYRGIENQETIVKWYHQDNRVEIVYGQNRLYFNLNYVTHLNYHTENGAVAMDIITHEIEKNETNLRIKYQLILENKPLGQYEFQLIYHA